MLCETDVGVVDTLKESSLIGNLRDWSYDMFHMSHDKRDMTEQQFNDHWDKISKLLTDFWYDISMLIAIKTEKVLSEDHLLRFKDILSHLECRLVRVIISTFLLISPE